MCSVNFQPCLAVGLPLRLARRFQHVVGNAGQLGPVGHEMREGVGGIEHVVVEARGQLIEALAHGLEPAFWSGGSSAPPRRKSRSSLSMIFLRAVPSCANSAEARIALNFAYRRSSCDSSV